MLDLEGPPLKAILLFKSGALFKTAGDTVPGDDGITLLSGKLAGAGLSAVGDKPQLASSPAKFGVIGDGPGRSRDDGSMNELAGLVLKCPKVKPLALLLERAGVLGREAYAG